MSAPRLFAVIGDPIAHSRSPAMHHAAFSVLGIDACYGACRVAPADLRDAIAGARALGFSGLNVTVPHKRAVLPLLDEVDDTARRIGAVNTIAFAHGKTIGHNTDAPGFRDALSELAGPTVTRAVVLGGGGAAGAVVDALRHRGDPIAVAWVTRRPARLPKVTGAIATAWDDLDHACTDVDLVVNATTIGMTGGPAAPRSIPWDRLAPGARMIDLVVTPGPGSLMAAAAAAGLTVADGRAMLVWQGVGALRIWLGREIGSDVVAAMRAAIA